MHAGRFHGGGGYRGGLRPTRRANQQIRVQPPLQKYFRSRRTQITFISPPFDPERGALAIVTNVGVGCGGRGSVVRAGDRRAGFACERSNGAQDERR